MIKAILVDDELNVRNLLRILLTEHCPEVQVVAECADLPEAIKNIRKHKPALVFLDIEMPGHSGLELLDFFDEKEIDFQIIFATAYSEYAIQAFDLSAVGYLLKPIKPAKLVDAVNRFKKAEQKTSLTLDILRHNLSEAPIKRITLATKYKTYFVNLTDIVFIKGDGSYSEFNLTNGEKILMSKNLKHFEDILAHNSTFLRISKQSIVNKSFIQGIIRNGGSSLLLINNVQLSISPDKEHLLV